MTQFVCLICAMSGSAGLLSAQTVAGHPAPPTTRAQLVERARVADSLGRKEEAFLLRSRLRNGDFEVGDQIIVDYNGAGLKQRDSLVVQAGRVLHLVQPLGDLNLEGMLRFELTDTITALTNKYFKDEQVRVSPLLRLAITGAVGQPGNYYVFPDKTLADVITRTAGHQQTTDLTNIVIMRGESIIWQKDDVRAAFVAGMTVDQLGLEPGDNVVVGMVGAVSGWQRAAMYFLPLASSVLLTLLLRRNR